MQNITNLDTGIVVSDIKQWAYCPRVFYYRVCLPHVRPVTYKMIAGEAEGEMEEQREMRRSLRVYGIKDGCREFNVKLSSPVLGVHGEVDMVITSAVENETIPVDYKMSETAGSHFKQQLTVYALMLEEIRNVQIRRGFLYLIPLRRAVEVRMEKRLRSQTLITLSDMQRVIVSEQIPPPVPQRGKCVSCEFRRFCNDVY